MKSSSPSTVRPGGDPPAASELPLVLVRTKPIGTSPSDFRACESLASWTFRLQKSNGLSSPSMLGARAKAPRGRISDAPTNPEKTALDWAQVSRRSPTEIAPLLLSLGKEQQSVACGPTIMRAWALCESPILLGTFAARHVVCSACLAHDEVPYWRRSWRFATTTACDVHGTGMLERCPECHGAFTAPRKNLWPLSHCGDCSFDLRCSAIDTAAFQSRVILQTLHDLYGHPANTSKPSYGLPCRALRRLLGLAGLAEAGITSIEMLVEQRVQKNLARRVDVRIAQKFSQQPIEIRSRAAWLVEDFAVRRPIEFFRLVHVHNNSPATADWLADFHGVGPRG